MSEPLRYILLGADRTSHWLRSTLPRLHALNKAQPAAVVDTNPDRLKAAQECLGLPKEHCFADAAEAMQRRRADFAIIALSTLHHEKAATLALTFDLHLLCEAPLAETMEAALRIYRRVRAKRKHMAVVMGSRFEQDKQTLTKLVASRRWGRVNYIVGRFSENCRKAGSWGRFRHEMQDPLLIEAGVHHLDVFRALAGDSAKSVHVVSWNPAWGEYRGDSTALVTMEMANGVHCLYEGAKASATSINGWGNEYFRVECEHATLELDQRRIRVIAGGGLELPKIDEIPLLNQPAWGEAWQAELFCDWLAGGPEPPNTLSDHIRFCATLFAAVESAHLGKTIEVREYLARHLKKD